MGPSGRLANRDVSKELEQIQAPTLTIGARHGTMDPEYMEWMPRQVQHGRYLYCKNGSQLDMYDDQKTYMAGVIQFIEDVDKGEF